MEAATQIDFASFPNVDKIFFECSPGNIQLIFNRSVFAGYDPGSSVLSADKGRYPDVLAPALKSRPAENESTLNRMKARESGTSIANLGQHSVPPDSGREEDFLDCTDSDGAAGIEGSNFAALKTCVSC